MPLPCQTADPAAWIAKAEKLPPRSREERLFHLGEAEPPRLARIDMRHRRQLLRIDEGVEDRRSRCGEEGGDLARQRLRFARREALRTAGGGEGGEIRVGQGAARRGGIARAFHFEVDEAPAAIVV